VGGGGPGLHIPETDTHPKNNGHLKGGVHDRPFKQYLSFALSAKPFKQHLMEIVPAIGFQVLRQNLCDETVSYRTRGQFSLGLVVFVPSCCKLLFFNFATKPFIVTRNAKRPRHNHPIETAIHS
jgi:hypothetical protein